MRLAPNRVPDADGLYLVTRSGPPVEEGGDMRDGSPGVDPLDPLGRPEAALDAGRCRAWRRNWSAGSSPSRWPTGTGDIGSTPPEACAAATGARSPTRRCGAVTA